MLLEVLLAPCLPLAPARVSDDESWVSEVVGDELAGESRKQFR